MPVRRSRRISGSSHDGDSAPETATVAEPLSGLRRSRRVSQTSEGSDHETIELPKSQKRSSTPRSATRPKIDKKAIPMEPLIEEDDEDEPDKPVGKPGRKRRVSETVQMEAIPEEPSSPIATASPVKRGRKSSSATAVLQRSARTPNTSKTETKKAAITPKTTESKKTTPVKRQSGE